MIKYPLAKQTIDNHEINNLISWLQTYPKLTKGDITLEFEKQWAEYIGTSYSVFVNSGSSANLLAINMLQCIDDYKVKNVVVPSVGWITTVAPVIQFGMNPIMVGADRDTYGVDLNQLEDTCKKQKIDAVIFVQVLGIPHKLEILQLKEKYGFILIEDACAALGSEYNNSRKVGTIGDMSTFSFYFGHQLSTIEGGMINTNDRQLYNWLLMARSHGWTKDLTNDHEDYGISIKNIDDFHKPFTFFMPGFNVRSTDLQAFIGLQQINKAEWVVKRRNENHERYAKNLLNIFEFQNWNIGDKPVSISFGALAKNKQHRTEIVTKLVNNGIETRIFSAGNLGLHPFWIKRYGEFHNNISDKIHSCGFFLPNYPELTLNEVDFICEIIK